MILSLKIFFIPLSPTPPHPIFMRLLSGGTESMSFSLLSQNLSPVFYSSVPPALLFTSLVLSSLIFSCFVMSSLLYTSLLLRVSSLDSLPPSLCRRIGFCLDVHNEAIKSMRYPPDAYKKEMGKGKDKDNKDKPDEKSIDELIKEMQDEMDED